MTEPGMWFVGFPELVEDEPEDLVTEAREAAAKARRVVVLRGSRWAEVSKPPVVETR